ncbi:unnamed protein product [Meganyctiphanes norvegica]|uniref:Nucleoporin Nup120/160 beta-propeller domain-containing protein n=1 Tax=Meganyctiphanes norvegica TaxID=48144 RepID=A0AAV2Q1Q0_MEGNR
MQQIYLLKSRFADTPILEGLSIHETNHHVIILLATVSSVHRIRLPHPQSYVSRASSIFSDLTFQTLKDHHNLHLLNNSVSGNVGGSGEGLPHTAGTHLVSSSNESSASGCGDAIFILGLAGGALMVVRMTDLPYSVHTHAIKNASLMNRLFTGFVPGMFR